MQQDELIFKVRDSTKEISVDDESDGYLFLYFHQGME